MRRSTWIGIISSIVVLIGGLVIFLPSSNSNDLSTRKDVNQSIGVDMSAVPGNLEEEIQKAISRQSMSNVVVLDVRTDEEWNDSHAAGAFHWGLAEHIEKGELPPLGKNMEIYVYCRSGNRAGQAIRVLQEAGYTNLTNIRGLEYWVSTGGSVTSGVNGDIQGASHDTIDSNGVMI